MEYAVFKAIVLEVGFFKVQIGLSLIPPSGIVGEYGHERNVLCIILKKNWHSACTVEEDKWN